MLNIFSVDVEDYFHPSEIAASGDLNLWASYASRLDIGTDFLLDNLDQHHTKGTFFVLGWVAERYPRIVRKIADQGHEIGCHSYQHRLVFNLTPSQFKEDTRRAVVAIEDACGITPRVYRAPSYSIVAKSLWALDILAEAGFTHDSSICPVEHDRYGVPGYERHARMVRTQSGPLLEVPVATCRLGGRVTPMGGGAYLRLFPYRYTAAGIRRLNQIDGQPACMYFHPWEMDPDQPRLANGVISRMRTYTGLKTVREKISRLLSDFEFSTITAVHPTPAVLESTSVPLRRVVNA